MKNWRGLTAALAALALLASGLTIGPVQRAVSQGMVQITSLVGTEQISLNYPCTVSCFATTATLAGFTQSQPGNNPENAIVGGDASTNLFQRGSTVTLASPATAAYTADRWFGWGGTNTPVTVATSTDAPSNFSASFKITKASGAGVVQVCFAQEIETVNSYRFQSQVLEVDFHAKALAGFSAVSSNLAVYVLTGTGTDEGSANAAFSINAGGGSATPWTGATLRGGTTGYLIPINTTWTRYGVAVPIPATETEITVALCYTPVGSGGATDGFELAGIQATPNASLATLAGTAGGILSANDARAKAFLRRPAGAETSLQQRYTYTVKEPAAITDFVVAGQAVTTTVVKHMVQFPVTMRAAPTTSVTTGTFGSTIAAGTIASTCTVTATASSNTTVAGGLTDTCGAASFTAGFASFLGGIGGSGIATFSAEL